MMIERLHHILEQIEQLPPEIQAVAAEHLEIFAGPYLQSMQGVSVPPASSFAGIWSDLPDDMEEELDRMRHEAVSTPVINTSF